MPKFFLLFAASILLPHSLTALLCILMWLPSLPARAAHWKGWQLFAPPLTNASQMILITFGTTWLLRAVDARGIDTPGAVAWVCLAVADTLDSILTDRPYSKARSLGTALAELRRCFGTQFDPAVVEGAHRLTKRWPRHYFRNPLMAQGSAPLSLREVAAAMQQDG